MKREGRDPAEELWQELVVPIVGRDEFEKDRINVAIRLIRASIENFDTKGQRTDKAMDLAMIMTVWQLLTSDILRGFDRLFEITFQEDLPIIEEGDRNCDRQRLLLLMKLSAGLSIFRLNLTSVVMPGEFATQVYEAVEALDAGEVRDMLARRTTSKHKNPYSWNAARLRACEHVYFLVGQGFKKGEAQKSVSNATFITVETLRAWEREFRKDLRLFQLQIAQEAGSLSVGKTNEKSGFRLRGVTTTAETLGGSALKKFASVYRERFGSRHLRQR